jgi:hypothetical protein
MWIIHEPKKVALWNKRHFEEKNEECATCLKYSVLISVEKNIYKMQSLEGSGMPVLYIGRTVLKGKLLPLLPLTVGYFSDARNHGSRFLQKLNNFLPGYTTSHIRRQRPRYIKYYAYRHVWFRIFLELKFSYFRFMDECKIWTFTQFVKITGVS